MKGLFLATDAFGGYGGIAQFNRDFVRALVLSPGVVSVKILPRIAPDPTGQLPPGVTQASAIFGRVAYSARAMFEIAKDPPDVIFCGHVFMAGLAWVLARMIGAKLVIAAHGIEVWDRPNWIARKAMRSAEFIVCASRDTRSRMLRSLDLIPENVIVINNTVSDVFTPGESQSRRRELGLGSSIVLLSISRLDSSQRYKGQDRVIPLLPGLLAAGLDVVYLIGGEGPDRARLERLAMEFGVSAEVRFLGRVPAEALPDLYRAADLFVMPSSGEGFGIVYLEAMASGTPALGLAVGGATDALAEGALGYCVSESKLALALSAALAVPRDATGLTQKVRDRFGFEKFQQRIASLVRRLEGEALEAMSTDGWPPKSSSNGNGFR